MSCWCARLHEDEIAAAELIMATMGREVISVELGKYPQVIFEPCARHRAESPKPEFSIPPD